MKLSRRAFCAAIGLAVAGVKPAMGFAPLPAADDERLTLRIDRRLRYAYHVSSAPMPHFKCASTVNSRDFMGHSSGALLFAGSSGHRCIADGSWDCVVDFMVRDNWKAKFFGNAPYPAGMLEVNVYESADFSELFAGIELFPINRYGGRILLDQGDRWYRVCVKDGWVGLRPTQPQFADTLVQCAFGEMGDKIARIATGEWC